MKNINLNSYVAAIGVIIILLTVSVNAQSEKTMNISVPFEFAIGSQVFEPGEYKIRRLNHQNRSMLVLQDADGNNKKIFLTTKVESRDRVEYPEVAFAKYEDRHFLSEIWTGGTKSGLKVPRSKTERRIENARVKKERIVLRASLE